MLILAHRQDIQDKAYQSIAETDPSLLTSPDAAHSKVEYIEALAKEIGRYFVVLRLALPKAAHLSVKWKGATIPPNTLVFLNSWACTRGSCHIIPVSQLFSLATPLLILFFLLFLFLFLVSSGDRG